MAQPKNFGYDEDAAALKSQAEKFFSDRLPVDQLHALVAHDSTPDRAPTVDWKPELWKEMVDLGWSILTVPEDQGGLGLPLVAVAGLIEAQGKAACPSPLLETLNVGLVLTHCGQAGAGFEAILEGKSAALAYSDEHGSVGPAGTQVTADKGTLSGKAYFVQEAGKVDALLVAARSESGVAWYWVDKSAAGVSVQQDAIIDLTRDQATVTFDGVAATCLGLDAEAAFAAAQPGILALLAADIVGAGTWLLQTTVEYVSVRKQFDHPLGFFQAVKHPLVNVMLAIDETKSLAYNAACAYDSEESAAIKAGHVAKASASETADFSASRAVQMHGGIGFTWECYVHLYFKRQMHSKALYGDAVHHRAELANIVLGPIAA